MCPHYTVGNSLADDLSKSVSPAVDWPLDLSGAYDLHSRGKYGSIETFWQSFMFNLGKAPQAKYLKYFTCYTQEPSKLKDMGLKSILLKQTIQVRGHFIEHGVLG